MFRVCAAEPAREYISPHGGTGDMLHMNTIPLTLSLSEHITLN